MPLEETCDFISTSPNGLIYLGTTDQAYLFDGQKLNRKIISREGSSNIQSAFYFDTNDQMWFTTYDALWCYHNKDQKGNRYQIPNSVGGFLNSDYHCFGWAIPEKLLWVKQGKNIYHFDIPSKQFILKAENIGAKRIRAVHDGSHYLSYYYTFEPKIIQYDAAKKRIYRTSDWVNWPAPCSAQDILPYDQDHVLIFSSCGMFLGNLLCEEIKEILWNKASLGPIHCAARLNGTDFLLSIEKKGLFVVRINAEHEISSVKTFLGGQFNKPVHRIHRDLVGTLFLSSYNDGISIMNLNRIIFTSQPLDSLDVILGTYNHNALFLFGKDGLIKNIELPYPLSRNTNQINQTKNQVLFGDTRLLLLNHKIHSSPQLNICSGTKTATDFNEIAKYYRVFKTSSGHVFISGEKGKLMECNSGEWKEIALNNPQNKIINYINELGTKYLITSLNEDVVQIYDRFDLSKPLKEIMFSGDIYQQVYDSAHSRIFFATTQGILEMTIPGFQTKVISLHASVDESECRSIIMDSTGMVWGASKSKIINYNPQQNHIMSFGKADGVPDGKFLIAGTVQILPDSFLFITNHHVLGFNPYKLKQPCIQPKVALTDFALNYIPSLNPDTLEYLNFLKLKYQENNISFTIKGINYTDPEDVELQYYLEPLEPSWKFQPKKESEVNYNKLNPGIYTLHVKSISTNKQCESDTLHLPIEILTPYWMQTWFRLLVIFSILMVGLSILKIYYQRQLEKKDLLLREQRLVIDKQLAIEQERNRIAGEMHDDLGSGLTTIRYLSDRAVRQAISEEEKMQVRKIADQSNQLLRNMSEIIWALNIRNDSLDNLLAYLRRYAHEFLEEQQIPVDWMQAVPHPSLKISGEKRRNILLAVKEILNNIVKHAQASKVQVSIMVQNQLVQLSIQDNGIGFDFNAAKERGNGLHNLQKRMSQAQGSIDWELSPQGTTVTLSFPVEQASNSQEA